MTKNNLQNLGDEIKKEIRKKGLNQSTVAKLMGVHRQTINNLESRKTFDLTFLQKLKEATGLDYTHYIFDQRKLEYIPIYSRQNLSEEPHVEYGKTIEMQVSVIINANPEQINKMGDLVIAIKNEAMKLGFTVK